MSDLDHTKSLKWYKDILETHEEEYRGSKAEKRSDLIDLISEDIKKEAGRKGAKITDGDALKKVCGMFTLQHYPQLIYSDSKSSTTMRTTDQLPRQMKAHPPELVNNGMSDWWLNTCSMIESKRR